MGATVTDPLVGRLVDGRYQVVSRIARGGMATVYLAVDRRLDRDVALKVMHPHLAEGSSGADFVARFRREARAAARLTHPGLVGVYDQGVDGETSYLTMEYVDGVNLRRHLAERGSLTVGEALAVGEQVLDALAAAHRAGLVHRDVKPENVLLATDGRIKVADFGLARAVTEVTSTTTGTVFGTVAYLAPELVVRGDSDARTDVYAAGVLVYEMLTGAQPFTGETPIQIAFQHVNSDVPAPSDTASWLPVELDELVGALAARDPADRPSDATAALALLRRTRAALDERTLARRTDVAPAVTLPQATDPEQSGDTGDATGGAGTGGISVSGAAEEHEDALPGDATTRIEAPGRTVALPIGVVTASRNAPEDLAATRRRRRWPWVVASLLLVALLGGGGAWWYAAVGPGAYTVVPDVTSLSQEDALAALDDAGLGADPTEAYDDAAVGTVVAANPADGERIRKDGTVELTVSRGPDLVEVPADVVGAEQDVADAALVQAGLVVDYRTPVHHDTVGNGFVLSLRDGDDADLAAGTSLKRGTTVYLTLSSGPAPVDILNVVGATVEEATRQLQESGLEVETTEDFSDTVAQGRVIAQDPAGGSEGKRTQTVTLTVSKGPETVEMPNLRGKQYDEAASALEALGLKAERDNVLGGIFGTVRDQSVAAGEAVPIGSTITLTVV